MNSSPSSNFSPFYYPTSITPVSKNNSFLCASPNPNLSPHLSSLSSRKRKAAEKENIENVFEFFGTPSFSRKGNAEISASIKKQKLKNSKKFSFVIHALNKTFNIKENHLSHSSLLYSLFQGSWSEISLSEPVILHPELIDPLIDGTHFGLAILALSQVGNYPYSLQKLIEKSSNPLSLYAAASYLQFDYLKEQTLKFIKNSVSFENLFDVIQFACYYQLITELETPILDNLQICFSSLEIEELSKFPFIIVYHLFQRDSLVIPSETVRLRKILHFIVSNQKTLKESEIQHLLNCVSFSAVNNSLIQLETLQNQSPFIQSLFLPHFQAALQFQSILYSKQPPLSPCISSFRYMIAISNLCQEDPQEDSEFSSDEEEMGNEAEQKRNTCMYFDSQGKLCFAPEEISECFQHIGFGSIPIITRIFLKYENRTPFLCISLQTTFLKEFHFGYYLNSFLIHPLTQETFEFQQLPNQSFLCLPYEKIQTCIINNQLILIIKMNLEFDSSFNSL